MENIKSQINDLCNQLSKYVLENKQYFPIIDGIKLDSEHFILQY